MKREYTTPVMECETFVPDEYVAACYRINCNVPGSGYLYAETNGEDGLQRTGRNPDRQLTGIVSACDKWHNGIIRDEAPEVNGYWYEPGFLGWGSETTEVFWWEEDLGSGSDYHATRMDKIEWETNPNAS